MATPYRILIRPNNTGLWKSTQDEAAAAKVTKLLQDDLEKHNVFYNVSGFHNHIAHQLLTLYSTGASAATLQTAYNANDTYQLELKTAQENIVHELQNDWSANGSKYLGVGKYYPEFLKFFQLEIEKNGWEAVITEFLCQNTSKSRSIVQRLFAGIAHPMIQLQYGLEWEQPAIIAQGLAQAAVHGNPLGEFYDKVDAAVKLIDQSSKEVKRRNLSEICENIRSDNAELVNCVTYGDSDLLYKSVLGKGLQDAVALGATLRVEEDEMEEKVAELFHHNAYVAAAASWNPPHIPKYDFFLIHSLNACPFFLSFDKTFIPTSAKIRILEHKMRYDLVQYIARGSAPLSMSSIREYDTEGPEAVQKPSDFLPRYHQIIDDGHLIKVARSLLLAQEVSRKWKGRPWVRFDGDDDWKQAHYMLLKGAKGQDTLWIRGAGFQDAWKEIPRL